MNRIIADAGRQQNGLKFSTNITKEVFAAQAGISCAALSSWLRRVRSDSAGNQPQFVPVPNLLPAGRGGATYRLQWPDGFILEVVAGFAASELSTLLKVVQRS